jgi:FtsP/CotA-like multicopper oxidase with cupredoxin domain
MKRHTISRRSILASGAALAAVPRATRAEDPPPTVLRIERRVISVGGKPATVLGLRQPDGTQGLVLPPGQRFRVKLENRIDGPSIIHWHGQTPPYGQDGVVDAAEAALKPGEDRIYDFAPRPGTHWMHSHHGLQEQALLAAPLIVQDAETARQDAQDVVVLFRDFTWKDADAVLAGLRQGGHSHAGHGTHAAPSSGLNDIAFDAFLANDRTLDDPEVFRTEPGGMVRLRLINGATATQFWIDLGPAEGQVVAVDGNPVVPVRGRKFPLATAQRLDIMLRMPPQGALPVLAQVEGLRARTGFVLAPSGATIARVAASASSAAPAVDLSLEEKLRTTLPYPATDPVATHTLMLTGGMHGYDWGLNDAAWGQHTPIPVQSGQFLRIDFANRSPMAHPMHLHGHHFRVAGLNGRPVNGAIRDTVLVPADGGRVSLHVLADNPGRWLLHCHNLYHMAAGMMTELVYPAS